MERQSTFKSARQQTVAEAARLHSVEQAVGAALDRRRCPSPLFTAPQMSSRAPLPLDISSSAFVPDMTLAFNSTTATTAALRDAPPRAAEVNPLQRLRMERTRASTPSAIVKRTSTEQVDRRIGVAVNELFQRHEGGDDLAVRPRTTDALHGVNALPPLGSNRRGRQSMSHRSAAVTSSMVSQKMSFQGTTLSAGFRRVSDVASVDDDDAAQQHCNVMDIIHDQLSFSDCAAVDVDDDRRTPLDRLTKDFSCVTFNDTTFAVFLRALGTVHGVEVLNLQYVSAPFGQEHKLLHAVAANPTPITHVDIHCSSFAAHKDLCESLERILEDNRRRSAIAKSRKLEEEQLAHRKRQEEALQQRTRALWAHTDKLLTQHRREEHREWQLLMEVWSIATRSTTERDMERAQSHRVQQQRNAIRSLEATARVSIVESETRSFDRLANDSWSFSRHAVAAEEKEQRRSIWRMYCDGWLKASVSTKRRYADKELEIRRFEVATMESRQVVYAEQAMERNALRVQYVVALESIAVRRQEARLKKDEDYRKFRQRHQEEEFALEQLRAKARMESMLHGGDGSGGTEAASGTQGGGRAAKHKPFRLGDEETMYRQMEELSTQILESLMVIRKHSERCVLREGKIRATVIKYQNALQVSPRLAARVSPDAPPTVYYDGQQHPVELESTLALQVSMDSFWTVRCDLLRDELQKLIQPYRQSRKECSQQLFPVMQDIDRCYRAAGLQGQMAWPAQMRAAYIGNSTTTPNKELMDHVEKLLLQSVKKLKLSKETIVCGVLRAEVPEHLRCYGGLALDEAALLAFRDLKPQLYHCSKPISMWECTYEGIREDIPIPPVMQVDKSKLLEITLAAQVTKRDDLLAVEDPTPLASHRSYGGGSHPATARGTPSSSPRQNNKKTKPPKVPSTSVSPTHPSVDAFPKASPADHPVPTAAPTVAAAEEPMADEDPSSPSDAPTSIPIITTTSTPPCSPNGHPAAAMAIPDRSLFAAAAIEVTIPTGVTPEQIEAVARCIKFVALRPAASHLLSAADVPTDGEGEGRQPRCGGGAVTALLPNRQAIIASIRSQLTLFTKGIRQRLLPPTNLTIYGERNPFALSASGGRPSSSGTSGKPGSPLSRRPSSPVPAIAVPQKQPVQDDLAISLSTVRRLNPLKALSIRRNALEYSLSFLLAPMIIEFSPVKLTVEHDARSGACKLLGEPQVNLFQPPLVVRSRKNPFSLAIIGHRSNPHDASSPFASQRSALDDSTQFLLSTKSGDGGSGGASSIVFPQTTGGEEEGGIVAGGETAGSVPFRGMTVSVSVTQGARMSAEDSVVVESSEVIAAKQGQIFYLGNRTAAAAAMSTVPRSGGDDDVHQGDPLSLDVHDTRDDHEDPFSCMPQFDPSSSDAAVEDASTTATPTGLAAAEQIGIFEQLPQELRITFLIDHFVTADVVEATLREVAYRNISVDPTVGLRKLTIKISSPVGVTETYYADVAVTAADDPTDWAVHKPERVVYFPMDTAHAREWLTTFENMVCELPPLPRGEGFVRHPRRGSSSSTGAAISSRALDELNRIVPAAVLRFADAVEVLDDDTTFFSAGHLRFALFNACAAIPLGASPVGSAAVGSIGDALQQHIDKDDAADYGGTSQSGVEQLMSIGEPCTDDGVGIFLDIPMYKTRFGLCMVPRAASHQSAGTDGVDQCGADGPLSFGGACGEIFDLYDDGYLQGTVRLGEQVFGYTSRRFVSQPSRSDIAAPADNPLSAPLSPTSDVGSPSSAAKEYDTIFQTHMAAALQEDGQELAASMRERHTPRVCVHALSNEIHIEFARGGNGATVDAVQELLKAASFVDLKRFPLSEDDVTKRLATINMLVGATTGRRDIMGELLPDTNVNHPLHAVISIETRGALLKANSDELRPAHASQRREYPENSGQMFLLNHALALPHSFVGGYLRVELVDGYSQEEDRVDCVDRVEAIGFQEREREEYNRKMTSGAQRSIAPATSSSAHHRASVAPDLLLSASALGGSVASFGSALPTSRTDGSIATPRRGSGAMIDGASLMSLPSSFADASPHVRYGAVRLVQNAVTVEFPSDCISTTSAAVVTPSFRSLVAYSMHEFAKVNMLSSSAESVAAQSAALGAGVVSSGSGHSTGAGGPHVGGQQISSGVFSSGGGASSFLAPQPAPAFDDMQVSFLPTKTSYFSATSDDGSVVSPLRGGDPTAPSPVTNNRRRSSRVIAFAQPAYTTDEDGGGASDDGDELAKCSTTLSASAPTVAKQNSSLTSVTGTATIATTAGVTSGSFLPKRNQSNSITGFPTNDAAAPASTEQDAGSPSTRSAPNRRRSRSVMFHRESLREEMNSRFDDHSLLEHSLTNPVLHATLLAASTGRRSSLFHMQRSGSRDGSASTRRRSSSTTGGKRRRSLSSINRGARELVWANRLKKILLERSDSFMFLLNKSCARLIADRLEHLMHLGVDERFVDDFKPYTTAHQNQPASTSFLRRRMLSSANAEAGSGFCDFSQYRRTSIDVTSTTSPKSDASGCRVQAAAASGVPPVAGGYTEPPVTVHTLTEKRTGDEIATAFCHRASGALVLLFEPETVITPSYLAAATRCVSFESRSRCTLRPLRIVRLTLHMYEEGAASTLLIPLWVKPYDDPLEITLRSPFLRYRAQCTAMTPVPRQSLKGNASLAAVAATARAKPKKTVSTISGLAAAATSSHAFTQPIPRDGIGCLRLFPKEQIALSDADTTHWDGGSVEVTITDGGTRGDCLALLSEEQQRVVRKIFSDHRLTSSRGSVASSGGVTHSGALLSPSSRVVPFGEQSFSSSTHLSVSPRPPGLLDLPTPNNHQLSARSARSPHGEDAYAAAIQIFSDPNDASNDWMLVADPPFPVVSSSHIDPSQHHLVQANEEIHGQVFGVTRKLHIKSITDGLIVLENIGTVIVERGLQKNPQASFIDLERSKQQHQPPVEAAPATTTHTASPLMTAASPAMPLDDKDVNVLTLMRIDLSPPPASSPYNPRITLPVLKCLISNIGFFNACALDAECAWKTVTIAVHDALSPEPPALQSVAIECLPAYFYKPAAFCEPVLYTQRAAIENRFEFILQRLKSNCCSPSGGGDAKERMPLCTIEVFPVSGWLPRDTLMLRFSGSLYVLTQDGQVISNKEVVCKHTTVSASSIRAEVTKDCKGASWAKVAGFLALISYHFDMKDFGKDQPAPGAPGPTGGPAPAPGAAPNAVPQHDRVLALQITEPSVKDMEGRTETWTLLQRISFSSGITSDQ